MSTASEVLLPEGWTPPVGYANGIAVDAGRIVFISGQVGWDAQQRFHSELIAPQFAQALDNLLAVLRVAGGAPQHVCRITASAATSRLTWQRGANSARSGANAWEHIIRR